MRDKTEKNDKYISKQKDLALDTKCVMFYLASPYQIISLRLRNFSTPIQNKINVNAWWIQNVDPLCSSTVSFSLPETKHTKSFKFKFQVVDSCGLDKLVIRKYSRNTD